MAGKAILAHSVENGQLFRFEDALRNVQSLAP
jgi:hypothetical protein